jgi:hypothetical protein
MSSRCRCAEITIESYIATETSGLGGPMSIWRLSRLQEAFGTSLCQGAPAPRFLFRMPIATLRWITAMNDPILVFSLPAELKALEELRACYPAKACMSSRQSGG